MGKDAWDYAREKAIDDFLADDNIETLRKYDPDVIFGNQPYASAIALALCMGPKLVDVSTLDSSFTDIGVLKGKRVAVVNDDITDNEMPRHLIESFGPYVETFDDFIYAVGNPLRMFTFDELRKEYGGEGKELAEK